MSGRGKKGARDAAQSIFDAAHGAHWYLRRLQCICYNGTERLFTKTSKSENFLQISEDLVEKDPDFLQIQKDLALFRLDSVTMKKIGDFVFKKIS